MDNTFKKEVKEIERKSEAAGIIRHSSTIIREPNHDKSHPSYLNHSNQVTKPEEFGSKKQNQTKEERTEEALSRSYNN